MNLKSIIPLLIVLLLTACQKQDKRVKQYTKAIIGDYTWTGYTLYSTPIFDSGVQTGWTNIKNDAHFNAKIEKGKYGSITFLNGNYNYSDWDHEDNTLTFKSEDHSSFLKYYINKDSIQYIKRLGIYSSMHLHTN